jgi:hypothetical protein
MGSYALILPSALRPGPSFSPREKGFLSMPAHQLNPDAGFGAAKPLKP